MHYIFITQSSINKWWKIYPAGGQILKKTKKKQEKHDLLLRTTMRNLYDVQ